MGYHVTSSDIRFGLNSTRVKDHRGTWGEYWKARHEMRDFQETMRRQDPEFQKHRHQVQNGFRRGLPFKNLPYTGWLKLLRYHWTDVLTRPGFTPEQMSYASKAAMQNDTSRFIYTGSRYNKWISGESQNSIQGLRADSVILDDPHNLPATKGKKMKTLKPPKKDYNTCAVRFVRGTNIAKVYTYKVPKKTKLHLGEEIVVPSLFDGFTSNSVAVVVENHTTPQDTGPYEYKFITGRIVAAK